MFKRILFITLIGSLLCPLTALATMYFGASIGNTWQSADVNFDEVTDEISEISENSTGWKIFGGFHSESIFGIEGGYRDLGKIDTSFLNRDFSTKTNGWDIAAMAHFEIAIIDLFAKAGAFFWSSESPFEEFDESGTSLIWGLGAGVSLGPIGVRLEWESMEVDNLDNLSLLSLGATFGF